MINVLLDNKIISLAQNFEPKSVLYLELQSNLQVLYLKTSRNYRFNTGYYFLPCIERARKEERLVDISLKREAKCYDWINEIL